VSTNQNRDDSTINHFGNEWEKFNYIDRPDLTESYLKQFSLYLAPLPEGILNQNSTLAADFGAGNGRWAELLLPKVNKLYCVEPSKSAFKVLSERFLHSKNVELLNEDVESCSIVEGTLDFAMSLGVLHHIPDTSKALQKVFEKIKPKGYFLGYLYYDLSEKSFSYRMIWRASNIFRLVISKLPSKLRAGVCDFIALFVYFPLATLSRIFTSLGKSNSSIPLHHYSELPFYMMRNDALDRFGTPLEQRFSREEIRAMLIRAGAVPESVRFSEMEPFWTFSAQKA